MKFVQVAVNVPQVTGVFDYHIPEELEGKLNPGCLVIVPFGKQNVQGLILREAPEAQVIETKPVQTLLDPLPAVTKPQMLLAEWLSKNTLASLAYCISPMLPPGLSQQADLLYQLILPQPEQTESLSKTQQRILELLKRRGDLHGRQIDAVLKHVKWRSSAKTLINKGLIISHPVLPEPKVRPKFVRTVMLVKKIEDDDLFRSTLGRGKALERRISILKILSQEAKPVSAQWLYSASSGNLNDLHKLVELGFVSLGSNEEWRDPLENTQPEILNVMQLTSDQQNALDKITSGLEKGNQEGKTRPYLLHGVTGSGKTEIYLQAVKKTLQMGRQAIVLVPEIALTPQTIRRFLSRFPGEVGVIHSRLSPGERYDTWRRAREGLLKVIVGPRSALFTPLPDIGLIVLDECHDASYYQNEAQPHYHAVKTAIAYAEQIQAVVILGSATPSVELMHQAQSEDWHILKLPLRILAHRQAVQEQMIHLGKLIPDYSSEGQTTDLPLPPVTVIDMREELKAGNRSIFSRALKHALGHVLEQNQQAILYLNRKGTATYVFCRECGYSLNCPRCDISLTYHSGQDVLVCHSCNYQRKLPKKCPQCGSEKIKQFGTGTEKVEQIVQSLFPHATTLRWDAETTRKKGAHDIILSHFVQHNADILIGTQMLAKGLDLPLVTLVGVILADVGLNFPDFRAPERTFQLLTQVAGRAGRSPLGGHVIMQTFQPEHYAIQSAAEHDYEGFLHEELERRLKIGYPPFSRLIRLEYRHQKLQNVQTEVQKLYYQLENWIRDGKHTATEIIGPVPCFFGKVAGYYRWQMILRGPDPVKVLQGRKLDDWRIEVDPQSVL